MSTLQEKYHTPSKEQEEKDSKNTIPVFVYGSLLAGFGNHGYLRNSEKLSGKFTTKEPYKMVSLGGFPGVMVKETETKQEAEPHPVVGEVYRVNKETFKNLDRLEGNGSFYNRELVEIDGVKEKVWMYLLMPNSRRFDYPIVALDDKNNYSWEAEYNSRRSLTS